MNRYHTVIVLIVVIIVAWGGWMVIHPPYVRTVDVGTGVDIPDPEIPPPGTDDPVRIQEVYGKGKTYRRTVTYGIEAVGQHQSWGLGVDYSVLYAGRTVIDSLIEKNDGKTIIAKVTVQQAKTETARKQFEGVRIDLGERAHILLGFIGAVMPDSIPPGASVMVEKYVNSLLNTPEAREVLKMWPVQAFQIEAFEGYVFRVFFTDGTGVTNIELVQAPENRDYGSQTPYIDEVAINEFARQYNPIWDVAVFPDEQVPVGSTWTVYGGAFPNLFPPSMYARITDSISIRRNEDKDGAAILAIPEQGSISFEARPRGKRMRAKLSVAGEMQYDLAARVFTEARLHGALPMESMSTDHILFPEAHKLAPLYDFQYSCEVVK